MRDKHSPQAAFLNVSEVETVSFESLAPPVCTTHLRRLVLMVREAADTCSSICNVEAPNLVSVMYKGPNLVSNRIVDETFRIETGPWIRI